MVIGIDDTIERRWGPKIQARGIYRDPVRSSRGHFTKASGLRWLSVQLLTEVPWARRVWALPFLTMLCPSQRYHARRGLRHKKLTDWARQALLQVRRWLPERQVVAVADRSFAALELLAAVQSQVAVVTRLRLDASTPRHLRVGPDRSAARAKRANGCRGSSNDSPTPRRRGGA